MKRPDLEIPGDLIEEFTARARVLMDMYRELSDPKTATSVITALIRRDPKAHAGFLDRLDPDRWPFGRPDLCLRIPDYVKREIVRPPQDVPVWILPDPFPFEAVLIANKLRRQGQDTSTRTAHVFEGQHGALPLGVRTIVPDGAYQDALRAAKLLVQAFERVQDIFEMLWPTGGMIAICLPR